MSTLLLVMLALAEPAPAPDAAPAATPFVARWYGWQILASDLAGIGIAYAGSRGDGAGRDVGALAGGAVLALGGPLIHAGHGEGWNATKSWALRAGGVTLGMVAGSVAARGSGCERELLGCLGEVAIGGVIGFGIGAVLDATLIGWSTPAELAREPAVHVAPGLTDNGSPTIGLAGTF